jgi:hypothetical protein
MTTGSYWNVNNPQAPWGWMDPDDKLKIPFDFATWLADQGTTYASHTLTCETGLQAVDVSVASGIVRVNVSKAVAGVLVAGTKYGVTCQVTAADGQKKSQTLRFKIREL